MCLITSSWFQLFDVGHLFITEPMHYSIVGNLFVENFSSIVKTIFEAAHRAEVSSLQYGIMRSMIS